MTALHFPDPPIRTNDFALRPWQANDTDAVVEACTDPETQRFIPYMPRNYTYKDADEFIRRAGRNLADGRAIGMAITPSELQPAIGSITLHAGEPWHWYIGYWMTPAYRGRGITSAAVREYSLWAFADYPSLVRLSLFTMPDNAASQRVAERAGFTREGLLRSWDDSAGTPEDVVLYSLVRTDLQRL